MRDASNVWKAKKAAAQILSEAAIDNGGKELKNGRLLWKPINGQELLTYDLAKTFYILKIWSGTPRKRLWKMRFLLKESVQKHYPGYFISRKVSVEIKNKH